MKKYNYHANRGTIPEGKKKLLNRELKAETINQKWCTDITYIYVLKEGWTYLASVMDLYSRKIMGYSYSTTMTAELAVEAVKNACMNVKETKGIPLFLIDENTEPIIRKIFVLRLAGMRYKAISNELNESGVVPPRGHYYQQRNGTNPTKSNHLWCDATIKAILFNEVYIGNLVQAKAGTLSYKNHKTMEKPKEEWICAEGTHEAFIDSETWERVQKFGQMCYHSKKQRDGATSILSGLMVCADCGFKVKIHSKNKTCKDGSVYHLTSFLCGSYARSGKASCTTHFIGEEILWNLVLQQIRVHAQMVQCDKSAVVEQLLRQQDSEAQSSRTVFLGELKSHQNRLSMLDKLIEKFYKDWALGEVTKVWCLGDQQAVRIYYKFVGLL